MTVPTIFVITLNSSGSRVISERFFRFLVVGGINTAITYVIYLWLLTLVDYRIAYSASFIFGILLALIMQARFVFKTKITLKTVLVYPLIYGVQYIVGLAIVTYSVQYLLIPKQFALGISVILCVPLMFFLTRAALKTDA